MPDVPVEAVEERWEHLRGRSETLVQSSYTTRRIYTLHYLHGDTEIDATVGTPRHETRYHPTPRGRPDYLRPPITTSQSGNRIQAIFDGDDYLVWELPEAPSTWPNPERVARRDVRSVILFRD